jgi:hypothetical protein
MGDQKGKQEMKLKKAMKLYPIEKGKPNDLGITNYRLNGKSIWPSGGTGPLWCTFGQENIPEHDAVDWLTEGTTRLSPIQIAIRNNKDIVELPGGSTKWTLRGRTIWEDKANINYLWVAESEHFRSSFKTEKEAVRWLLIDPEEVKKNVHTYFCVPDYRNALTKRMEEYEKMYSKKPFSHDARIHADYLQLLEKIKGGMLYGKQIDMDNPEQVALALYCYGAYGLEIGNR